MPARTLTREAPQRQADGPVFTEGPAGVLEFVGDFDRLYSEHSDPWAQQGDDSPMAEYYAESRARLLGAVLTYRPHRHMRAMEVGCGHGHVVAAFSRVMRGDEWIGMDISTVAIEQAKTMFPNSRFVVGDVMGPCRDDDVSAFDMIILNQTLWYVLHELGDAIRHCCVALKPGGLFMISQAFLKGKQRYGIDVADGFHGAVRLMVDRHRTRLRLIDARYDDSGTLAHNDGLLVFRKV